MYQINEKLIFAEFNKKTEPKQEHNKSLDFGAFSSKH